MVEKQQYDDSDISTNDVTKVGIDIVKKLNTKRVDWYSITDSLLSLLENGETFSAHQYSIINALETAQLGVQLSYINERIERIEKMIKPRAIKSP
jgi:hypothetical protein